ncbi:helix-turn-helix domain-containing protein, partial [Aerococcaceae bacterium 50-4]
TLPPKVRVKKLTFGGIFVSKYSEEFKIKIVNEYLNGNLSYVQLANKYHMPSDTLLQRWVNAYKTQGLVGLKPGKKKTVYTVEFKLEVVQFMIETGASIQKTANHFKLKNPSVVHKWKKLFDEQGLEGLKRKVDKEVYTVQFKLDTVEFMIRTGASIQETTDHFKLTSPSLVHNWLKAFNKQGIEGLKPKVKGRPSMSKKNQKAKNNNNINKIREEELARENELLRLEVAYLKKLKAFRENQHPFLEKRKLKWPSNSNKKDLN